MASLHICHKYEVVFQRNSEATAVDGIPVAHRSTAGAPPLAGKCPL